MPTLLPTIEHVTGEAPDAAVILLHGLGADGSDFVPIIEELQLPQSLSVRFVFPHAPVRRVTINGGSAMRAWYDIAHADLSTRADLAGVEESRGHIEALIEREKARGVASSRILLAGFSQGGAIALHTGLRHPERLAGIVALSTYLVAPDSLQLEASIANRGLPLFLAHGTEDPVVRLQWGDASRSILQAAGYKVDWRTYPMGHAVVWEEIRAVAGFIVARLLGQLLKGPATRATDV